MNRRRIATGSAWAIDASAIKRDADGFFITIGPSVRPNERCGDVTVIYAHGAFEHHEDGCGDSYDGLLARARAAFCGDDEGSPPKAVCLRLDSPGGAVSGLNQTVESLRRLSASTGIPLYAFVDELAASAAYAIACSAQEIFLPPSGICGSIGVISTMVSQARKDSAEGYDFVLLTSGARKADGHVHAPISDQAQAAEMRRVNRLAKQFYRLVERARPISAGKAASYEAAIFLGSEALLADVADGICDTWDDALETISLAQSDSLAFSGTDRPAQSGAHKKVNGMSKATLAALVRKTEARIKAEKDPKERKKLMAALEAYKGAEAAFKKTITHKETHEGDADSENDDGDEDDKPSDDAEEEEEEEAEEEEGGNVTDRKEGDGMEDDEEEEEEEEEAEEAEEKMSAKALVPTLRQLTGKRTLSEVVGVIRSSLSRANKYDGLVGTVRKLEAERLTNRMAKLVDIGVRAGKLTPAQAKFWRARKDPAELKAYLEVTPKDAVVRTRPLVEPDGLDGEEFALAGGGQPDGAVPLTKNQKAILDRAMTQAKAAGLKLTEEDFLKDARKANGAAPRRF